MNDRVGQQFGNYRLLRPLGQGEVSESYLAEHVALRTYVALKVWRTQLPVQNQEAFYNQARTLARLKHPNILQVLEFGVEGETPYLVAQYTSNGTLRQRHRSGSILAPDVIVPYVKQVVAALQYAHEQNVLHRDVKPENMLLGANNEVLLSDFGIIFGSQNTRPNWTSNVTYTAPEQLQGRPVTASDQYSLAAIVYEWLTGSVPFNGSPDEVALQHERVSPRLLREKIPTIPREVEQVVMIALSKDPQRRFRSVMAFANAFEQAVQANVATFAATYEPSRPPTPVPQFNQQPDATLPFNQPYNPPSPTPAFNQPYPNAAPASYNNQSIAPPPPAYLNAQLTAPVQQFSRETPPPPSTVPQRPPDQQRRGFSTGMRVLLAVVALLIILSGVGLIYYATVYHPNQLHAQATGTAQTILTQQAQATATQQANLNATATAQTNGTATAIAVVTAQAQATATELQNMYTQATSGTPAFSDPLSSNTNNWDEGSGSNGDTCSFTGGAYHVTEPSPKFYFVCFANSTNFSNFAFQVKMDITKGDAGGLLFRGDKNNFRTYRFGITKDGFYYLNLVQDSTHSRNLLSNNAVINTGLNQTNLLTVIARGGSIYLYINQQYVDNIDDGTYSSGQIGLFAQDNGSPTDVAFTNAQVWTL